MKKYNIDILGTSECRVTRSEKLNLLTGEVVIYLERDVGTHHIGVAIMMSK